MSSGKQRIFGWMLLIINVGYCILGLVTGSMEGLGDIFGRFTDSPDLPATFDQKPIVFLLAMVSHVAIALYGFNMIWLSGRR